MGSKKEKKKRESSGGEDGNRGESAGPGPGSATAVHCAFCRKPAGTRDHGLFLDAIADLIPPKYYLGARDNEDAAVPRKFLKKSARAEAKAQIKIKKREDRLAKYAPDAPTSTLEHQARLAKVEEGAKGLNLVVPPKPLSREELKARLEKKIEEIRARKGAAATAAREWQQKQLGARAAGATEGSRGKDKGKGAGEGAGRRKERDAAGSKQLGAKRPRSEVEGADADVAEDLSFARVEIGDGKRKKRHQSKQAILAKVEAEKERLESLQGTEEGKKEAFKRDWSSALKKAAGERVLDDPKLLRKSLKRETKAKQRSAEQWAERKKQQEKEQKERKLKRFQNITAKKKGNKARKIEKREKKLLRPGFEGRREGPVNKG